MGPIELQLMRELAIDLVRQCAERVLRDGDAAPTTARWYRHWFDGEYERWLHTPRAELGGLAPLNAIADERGRLGSAGSGSGNSAPHSLELYTDLPQLEPWPDAGSRDEALAPPWTAEPALAAPEPSSSSAVDEARWRRFCADHLAGWLEP